jgi:hypothetical protein
VLPNLPLLWGKTPVNGSHQGALGGPFAMANISSGVALDMLVVSSYHRGGVAAVLLSPGHHPSLRHMLASCCAPGCLTRHAMDESFHRRGHRKARESGPAKGALSQPYRKNNVAEHSGWRCSTTARRAKHVQTVGSRGWGEGQGRKQKATVAEDSNLPTAIPDDRIEENKVRPGPEGA